MGRVGTQKKLSLVNMPNLCQRPLDQRDKLLLRMLGAGQQGAVNQPTLVGKVDRQGKIAVKVAVGAADVLFLGSGVVHGKAVNVHGNMASGKTGERDLSLHKELDGCPGDDLEKFRSIIVHSLPH